MDSPDQPPGQEGRTSVTAPRVQVVVVAHEPGPWFDETLISIAGQDYPRFGVTVVASALGDEQESELERTLPDADVRRVGAEIGYAEAANELLADSSPPAFYLFCHDDVALASDALRLLVEEAIRSNASIVGPKLVVWERPEELLEVGLDVDKLGHPRSRVERGELDQEQHDAVTDVFAVPGAVQLVRADVFHALEGFDKAMVVTGEDVDFCWRAHVAGARVVVSPSAVVRHRAALPTRRRSAEVGRLRDRHRIRTILSNYGIVHSIRVVPQAVLYTLVRAIGALLLGQFAVARSAIGAWLWNLGRPASLLRRRRLLRRNRKLADREIRPLQIGGFAPVSTYFRGQFGEDGRGSIGVRARNLLQTLRTGPSRISLGFWALALAVLVFGSRHLITRRVPVVGDLVPFDLGPADLVTRWFDGWSAMGTGHEAAAPTAFGLTGVLGFVALGFMGLLRMLLTVGMLPIGAIGMWRLLRPFSSPWIRVVGTLTYLVSPVPYDALGNGTWSALILYGTLPWVAASIGRSGRMAPFGRLGGSVGEGVLEPSWIREVLVLGLLLGGIGAFVPFVAALVVAMAIAVAMGSLLAGWPGGTARMASVVAAGLVVGAALNLPWIAHSVSGERSLDWLLGTRPESPQLPELVDLLRLDSGNIGGGLLGWALPIAGIVPLLLARGPRWAWAVRGLALYLAAVAGVWATSNEWVPVAMPRPEVIFTLGSLGLAMSAAMSVAAIERDLRTYRFGWRQLLPVTAVAALTLALLPAARASFDGAWKMPDQEFNRQLGEIDGERPERVLWIGHDDVIGVGGRGFGDGLTIAVSDSREVGFVDRWAGAPQPADPLLGDAIRLAIDGGTSRLGRLLAPFAIGEIIVLEQAAPTPAVGITRPVPDHLLAALTEQLDLEQVEITPGVARYRNTAGLAVAAVVAEGSTSGVDLRDFAGSRSGITSTALNPDGAASFTGSVAVGDEVYFAAPLTDRWELEVDGRTVGPDVALDWAGAYRVPLSGEATLEYRTSGAHRLLMIGQLVTWVIAVLALLRVSGRAREVRS
ncbi:MAG: glycosyltransferase [Actinomycetota bacterium]